VRRLAERGRRRLDEVRPAPPRPTVDRRSTYGYAVIGVAVLTMLAWCTDQSRLALGFAVAAVLGVLWVAWTAHQALVTTALALVWWFVTAPTVGVIAATGIQGVEALAAVSPATATIGLLGVVVGLVAVLSRAPRPAMTVMVAWVTNTVAVVAASYVLPTVAWTIGYLVTLAVLMWRTGFRLRGRNRARPAGVPAEIYESLAAVPGGFVGALEDPANGPVTVLVAPSGTYSVTVLAVPGTVRATQRGTRLLLDGRTLPKVGLAVRSARSAAKRLRTQVHPVLVVLSAEFEAGLARLTADDETDVLVIRGDLVTGRLSYGSAVLSGGQINRLIRRIRAAAPPEPAEVPGEETEGTQTGG